VKISPFFAAGFSAACGTGGAAGSRPFFSLSPFRWFAIAWYWAPEM